MTRHTTFCFTLQPTALQEQVLWRHAGAARFAFNQSLQLVKGALEAQRADSDVRVPLSSFDLINAFNHWKRSADAGVHEDGSIGLKWRAEVLQEIFEEAAVDLGRGLAAFSTRRRFKARAAGFPKFKRRSDGRQSFRIRNKARGELGSIRVGVSAGDERSIQLPKIGALPVRESTRRLRRMLKKHRAKILFATVSHRFGGCWKFSLNLEAESFHPEARHPVYAMAKPIGIDRGFAPSPCSPVEQGERSSASKLLVLFAVRFRLVPRVKLASLKQKERLLDAREGRCRWKKLSTRFRGSSPA